MAQVTVKLVKSKIGCTPRQRAVLASLGLRKIRQENSFDDTPVVWGMINKVKHLVEVVAS